MGSLQSVLRNIKYPILNISSCASELKPNYINMFMFYTRYHATPMQAGYGEYFK